jgi:molybdopterin synthase catalytic subunit
LIRITTDAIDMAAVAAAVEDPAAGAIVTFAGTTRNETHGRPVVSLTYEAYPEMAVPKMEEIAARAREEFEILSVAAVHRIATLGIGEVSIGIAVSAPHRPAAFEACRFVIDEIKRDVPVWKKEVFADGSEEWVHPGECC